MNFSGRFVLPAPLAHILINKHGSWIDESCYRAGSSENVAPAPTFRRRLYDVLEANNKTGMVLEALTVLLIVVNVVCFMLSTENSLANNKTAWRIFDTVELCTVRTRERTAIHLSIM